MEKNHGNMPAMIRYCHLRGFGIIILLKRQIHKMNSLLTFYNNMDN